MKRLAILLVCIVASVGFANAQRLLPGQRSVVLSGGIPLSDETFDKNNFNLSVGMTYNVKSADHWLFSASYARKGYNYKNSIIPTDTYLLDGGYFLNVLSDGTKTVMLNVGLSGAVGYEVVNNSESLMYDGSTIRDEDNFLYGGALSFEVDTYLNDRFVIFANLRNYVLWGSDTDEFRPMVNVGLKIMVD